MGIGESVRGVGGWWRGQGVTFWLRVLVMVGRGTGELCSGVAGGGGWVGGGTGEQGAGCGGGVEGVGVVGGWAGVGGQGVGWGACVVCGYRWGWV